MTNPSTRARSDAQEKRVATLFNAKQNPNSGAVNNIALKSDVRGEDFVIECKCTTKDSHSINLNTIHKARKEAQAIGKNYWLDFEFQGESINDVRGSFIVIERDDFVEIFEGYEKSREFEKELSIKDFFRKLRSTLSSVGRLELSMALTKHSELNKFVRLLS